MKLLALNSFKSANEKLIFWGLFAVFLILRLTPLLTAVEWVSDWEELYRGTVAREIIAGLKMPLWDYQADTYSGGSLVVGVLAVPFFKIFGQSLFALKCVPLIFSAASFALLFFFLKRNFGMRTAVYTALFIIFCPPSYAQFSLVAMGYHSESILFSILMLGCFYEFRRGGKTFWAVPLLGAVCGFSIWFTYIAGISVATIILCWILMDGRSFLKNLPVFLIFFFLGLTPWLAYNAAYDWKGLEFAAAAFLQLDPKDAVGPSFELNPLKLARLLIKGIPLSFSFSDISRVPGWIVCYLYYGLAVLALLLGGIQSQKNIQGTESAKLFKRPFFLYPLVYLFVYWVSRVGVIYITPDEPFYRFFEFRYFVPLQFFLLCLLGFAAEASRLSRFIALGLWGLGFMGQMPLFFQEPFGRALNYKGYSYASLGVTFEQYKPFPQSLYAFLKIIPSYQDPLERLGVARGFFGWGMVLPAEWQNAEKLNKIMRSVPLEFREVFAEGLGVSFTDKSSEIAESLAGAFTDNEKDYFYYGLLSGVPEMKVRQTYRKWAFMQKGQAVFSGAAAGDQAEVYFDEVTRWENEAQRWFYRGAGAGAVIYWIFHKGAFKKRTDSALEKIPVFFHSDFFWGAGWEIAHELGEDEVRAKDWLLKLPQEWQVTAQEGFDAGMRRFWQLTNGEGRL